MEPLGHSCHSDNVPCPPIQISVSSTLPVSNESVIPSWLQRMKDEEEELQEAMAAALASGTAYYLDSTDNNNNSTMTDNAPPSFDPDAALAPDLAVRIIKPLPKRDLKSRFPAARVIKPLPRRPLMPHIIRPLPSLSDSAKALVVEGSATPSSLTDMPPSPLPTLISDHDMGGSENLNITNTDRVIEPLTATTQFYDPSDQNAGLSNVVQIRTSAIAEGLTTSLAPPLLPPPIRPIDNDIESFFATSSPHISKSLSNPMTGASTSTDSLAVGTVKPTSPMPSKFSSPVSFYTKNQSRVKLAQTSADASEDDEDVNALIKRFTKSRVVWVDDNPDPIPAPQPTVPLQMRFATPISPTHGCSARNMIVDTCELNHSEEVSQYDDDMSGTSQIYDPNIKNATLINCFQNTSNSKNSNNSFTVDDSSFSVLQHETNDVQYSDTIASIFEPNISSNKPTSFSQSTTSLSEPDLILNQLDGDATMGVVDRQPSQQGFDNDHMPSVEQHDSNPANSLKLTSIGVDNRQSPTQVSSEADSYGMNWDESDTALGLLVTKESTTYSVEESDVGHSLFLSNTKASKEMEELNEIDMEDTTAAARMSANLSLAKSRTPNSPPNLLTRSNKKTFMDNSDTRLHEFSSPQVGSLSLEPDNNSEPSVVALNPIPTSQLNTTNDVPILQPVHPKNPGETPADPSTNYMSGDSSYETLEEVRLGDDLERNSRIRELVVATGSTAGRFTSEESDSNSELARASVTANDPAPSTVQSQSASASDPIPSESAPANFFDPSSKRGQTTADPNSKHSDTASVENSSSLSESTQSLSAIFSVPAITITRCQSRTQSPSIHTSPAFLSPLFRPRSPNSPSLTPPAVPDNGDVPPPADVVHPPFIEVSATVQTKALDVVTPTAVTVSQFNTTHVPLYQDIPTFPDHVTFNTSFVPVAPVAEVYAPFQNEPSDIDMCPDSPADPLYLPNFHTISNNTSSNVPEIWPWGDAQQGPNEDDDRMDILLDEQMTFSSRSYMYGQSHQVDSEMASAGDWCYAEGDVEMAILPEPAATHAVTPMDIDPSGLEVATSLEASTRVPSTTQSLASISLPPRTTGIQYTPLSMTIPPLDPQLLTGDMSAFMQQISSTVKILDSLTSLEPEEAQLPQVAPAANRQPMVHKRVLQTPDFEALAHEPSSAEISCGAPDKDELSSTDGNSMEKESAQSEDIDSKVSSGSNLMWSLRKYGRGSMTDDASWAKVPRNDGEMQRTEQNDPPSEEDFTRSTWVSSKPKRNNVNLSRSFTGINPSRPRFRVRLAVDIVNTRFAFGTETSGPQFQPSAQSTALRMEVSSHIKPIPELATSAAPRLDEAVEAPSFWGMLWGALTSLFQENSSSDMSHSHY